MGYFIVMGDVIKSRRYRGGDLMAQFRKLVDSCNRSLAQDILSPYTITLGDEFQGVARSLNAALESLFFLEEARLEKEADFLIRYVVHYGPIDTALNRETAHGMLGEGLSRARELLTEKHRERPRFLLELPDREQAGRLNGLFKVMDSIIRGWPRKDYRLIFDMLQNENNAEVGKKYGKDRSQIYKRRKSLHIVDYQTLKELIFDLTTS